MYLLFDYLRCVKLKKYKIMKKMFKFSNYVVIDGIDNRTKDFVVSFVYIWRDIKKSPERYKEIDENLPQILEREGFDLNNNEIYILKLCQ